MVTYRFRKCECINMPNAREAQLGKGSERIRFVFLIYTSRWQRAHMDVQIGLSTEATYVRFAGHAGESGRTQTCLCVSV